MNVPTIIFKKKLNQQSNGLLLIQFIDYLKVSVIVNNQSSLIAIVQKIIRRILFILLQLDN